MRPVTLLLSLLVTLPVAACSPGDAAPANEADSGRADGAAEASADGAVDSGPDGAADALPGDGGKGLESMSAEEAEKLCRDTGAEASKKLTPEQMKQAACALAGAFAAMGASTDAAARAQCQAAYDACLAKPFDDAGPPKDACADFASKAQKCKGLTEPEYRAYVDEQTGFLLKLADPKVCSTLTVAGGPVAATPATDVVKAKCPELLSSGG